MHLDLNDVGAACRLIGNVDLLAGSPPCTDFSSEGACVEGENAGLTVAFAHLAVALRVRCVLLENVERLREVLSRPGTGLAQRAAPGMKAVKSLGPAWIVMALGS